MHKNCCPAAISSVMLISCAASAADRVSVQLLEEPVVDSPTTRAANLPTSSVKDVNATKVQLAIETIIDSNHAFLAECTVDGQTIHLSGTATPASDGACQVNVNFSCEKPGDLQQVKTSVLVRPREQNPIGGFSSGGISTRVMLEIQHDVK